MSPQAQAAAPAPAARRSISGGSTIARASRAHVARVERRVPAAPLKVSPAKPAPPSVVASGTATGAVTQPTLSASGELINQLKPQTSTSKTTQLNCETLSLNNLLSVDSLPRIV